MAIRLSEITKKYEISWTLVETFEICTEDLQNLEPTASVIPSTWGKSIVLVAKGNKYKQYIPVNDKSALQVNQIVNIKDLILQKLEKEGKYIYRAMLKSDI